MQNLEQELLLQVDQISTFLWMRTWELDFITYLLDDTGFNRAYFSDDIWTEIKTGIEKNNRRQWFYDQRALVMAYDLEPTLEQLDGYQWQYEGKVRLSARTEDDRKKEAIVPVKYVFGSNPLHASDINPGGFYVTDLDIDLKTAFDQIYEALPIVKNSEKPDISGGDR
jgi:hypothetical protein